MDIKLTITVVLDDSLWGFSDLLDGRELNRGTKSEIEELLWEDITSVIEDGKFEIEEYVKPTQ